MFPNPLLCLKVSFEALVNREITTVQSGLSLTRIVRLTMWTCLFTQASMYNYYQHGLGGGTRAHKMHKLDGDTRAHKVHKGCWQVCGTTVTGVLWRCLVPCWGVPCSMCCGWPYMVDMPCPSDHFSWFQLRTIYLPHDWSFDHNKTIVWLKLFPGHWLWCDAMPVLGSPGLRRVGVQAPQGHVY